MISSTRYLENNSFFAGLSPQSRKALGEISGIRKLGKNEILFHEGEKGFACGVLIRGSIHLYKVAPDGQTVVIKMVQPGELFAEVILFESPVFPVSARAMTDSQVLLLPRMDVRRLLQQEAFRDDFMAMLMERLRYLSRRIHDLSGSDVEQRLVLFLREHYGEEPLIHCPLSKKDVAAAIGVAPETLSRLLGRLRGQATLHWKGKKLECSPSFWDGVPRPINRRGVRK